MNWYSIDEIASEKHLPLWAVEACVNREDFPKDGFRYTNQPKYGLENDGYYYWGEFELIEEEVLEVRKDVFEAYWQKLIELAESLSLKTKNKGFYTLKEFDELTNGWTMLRRNIELLSSITDDYLIEQDPAGRCALFIKKPLLHTLLIEWFNQLNQHEQNEIRSQLGRKRLTVVNDKIKEGALSLEIARLNSWLVKSRLAEVCLTVKDRTKKRNIPLWVLAVPA